MNSRGDLIANLQPQRGRSAYLPALFRPSFTNFGDTNSAPPANSIRYSGGSAYVPAPMPTIRFNTATATATATPASNITTSPSSNTSPTTPAHSSPSRHLFSRRRLLSHLQLHTRRFCTDASPDPAVSQSSHSHAALEHRLFPASPLLPPSSPQSISTQADESSSATSLISDPGRSSLSTSPASTPSWPATSDPASCPIANFSLISTPGPGLFVSNIPLGDKGPPPFRMTRNSGDQMAATSEAQQPPSIRFIPFHDPRASRPSLTFQALSRTLPSAESVIKVGRYSERDAQPGDMPRGMPSSAPVGFKSKVVSRRHCEFWCEGLQWWVKDVKSSSGTFLNHLRLSPPGVESKPWKVNDGDVIQLGIDFRGGEEMIFRCVKIRIELNRGWQKALNNFNKSTHRRIRKLQEPSPRRDSDNVSMSSSECAICLMGVLPCQSLFVAPCSHVWHYKCIRPILTGPGYPQFLCPNCRAVTDLEADIEEAESDWEEDLKEAIAASRNEPADPAAMDATVPNGVEISPRSVDANGDITMVQATGPPSRPAPSGPPSNLGDSTSPPPQSVDGLGNTAAINIPPRTVSPGSRRFEVMTHGTSEGPQTPRNDAGPFVLDGGAGQPAGSGMHGSRLNPANTTGGSTA